MKTLFTCCAVILLHAAAVSQQVDSAMIAKIRDEGLNRSQAKEILSWLTDVHGPRLTGSPGYKRAADWTVKKLNEWGLADVHIEGGDLFGKGWQLKKYSANVIGSQVFPLISYPKAWSPELRKETTADVVYLDVDSAEQLDHYKGTLKGKFVLLSKPTNPKPYFDPPATRISDSALLIMANADVPGPRRMNFNRRRSDAALLNYKKWELLLKENVAAVLTTSSSQRSEGGNIMVMGAYVPNHPDTPYTSPNRLTAYGHNVPKNLPPQIEVGSEQYNRMVRMIEKKEKIKVQMQLDVEWSKEDSLYNVIAEIPGTDLKDEVVMIGAHLDSWHGGTGATDNGTGTTACMEAVRILQAIGAQPRRTIRIGLWAGEEQGLLGSRTYVDKHFGEKDSLTPAGDRFSAYFNNDNGTGKVRGIYLQGNEPLRTIFRAWLKPFEDLGASTITASNTGGTDHQSFDRIGLPGFQFIQDEIEYDTRTWHTTMDVWERAQEEDMKQAAVLMAAFAYNAAMRDEKLPRKQPLDTPQGRSVGFEPDEHDHDHEH